MGQVQEGFCNSLLSSGRLLGPKVRMDISEMLLLVLIVQQSFEGPTSACHVRFAGQGLTMAMPGCIGKMKGLCLDIKHSHLRCNPKLPFGSASRRSSTVLSSAS